MSMADQALWIRQATAIGLLIASLAALLAVAAAPFLVASGLQGDIEGRRELLTVLERRAGDRDRLKSESERLAASGNRAQALLDGDTYGIASANLQKLLVDTVQAAGLSLRSIQALDPAADGDLTVVAVRLVCRGGIDGLRTLLHTLETGEPLLFVDELLVKQDRSGPAEGPRVGGVELSVELRVNGHAAGRLAP